MILGTEYLTDRGIDLDLAFNKLGVEDRIASIDGQDH